MYDFNFGWEFSVPEIQWGSIDMPNILASKDKGEIQWGSIDMLNILASKDKGELQFIIFIH